MLLNGNMFVVGAYGDEEYGNNSGSVYLYNWNSTNWIETKITATDGDNSDCFGYDVSITSDGKSFVSGAYGDEENGNTSGSVYVYR